MRAIKKIFLSCVSLIALTACERAIDDIPQNKVHPDIDVPFSNYDVTEGMAKRLAMIVAKEDIVEVLPLTFGYSDTLLYAIDFNKGWLLLSADMRAHPILAKSSDGHFTDKEDNHGFKTLIDMYADNIRRIKDDDSQMTVNDLSNNPESSMWLDIWRLENTPVGRIKTRIDSAYAVHERIYLCKRLTSSSITDIEPSAPINHFIETKWGQGQPWNSKVPIDYATSHKCPVGCVAVAVGQILYYTHKTIGIPTGLRHGSHFEGSAGGSTGPVFIPGTYVSNSPRWDSMAHSSLDTNVLAREYVAEFLADIGHNFNTDYSFDGSSSYITKGRMQNYGVTCNIDDYDFHSIQNELLAGKPIMVSAYTQPKNYPNSTGHCWIIDGIRDHLNKKENNYIWEVVTTYWDHNGYFTAYVDGEELLTSNNIAYLRPYYDEVYEYDTAISLGHYEGETATTTSTYHKSYSILMNWGHDGSGDNAEYDPYFNSGTHGFDSYKYDAKMYYSIREY